MSQIDKYFSEGYILGWKPKHLRGNENGIASPVVLDANIIVTIDCLVTYFKNGQSDAEIANDVGISVTAVEDSIRYWLLFKNTEDDL